jgi:hypothetical protein
MPAMRWGGPGALPNGGKRNDGLQAYFLPVDPFQPSPAKPHRSLPRWRPGAKRTREIGLRQAVGATTGDILLQVLIEASRSRFWEASLVLVLGDASVLISRVAQLDTVLSAGSILLAFALPD